MIISTPRVLPLLLVCCLAACRGGGQDALGYSYERDYGAQDAAMPPAGEQPPERPLAPVQEPKAQEYTVQAGDTLYQISTRLLGHGRRWPEIARLNGLDEAGVRSISVGQVLQIPAR